MNNLINWSNVSRFLTGNRNSIRSDHKGGHEKEVNELKKLVENWTKNNKPCKQ